MATKKQLTSDPNTGHLSRLNEKDLPLIGIDGLTDGNEVTPFGTLTSDIIECCIYDESDNYLASTELQYPLPENLDVGEHLRSLGYERGTYKIVYNFLRRIGGSSKTILTKKSDKSIFTGEYMVETNGKVLASESPTPDVQIPLLDENGKEIELLVQDDNYFIQEISPSRTEIRLRPNPAIVDTDYFEQFRLLGYTCLSYSDVSGESNLTFEGDGKTATINGGNILLTDAMKGGTLKIREAFVIDYEDTPEVISRYNPVVDLETIPAAQNLVTNGHFANGDGIAEVALTSGNHEIVEYDNPGSSKYVLKTSTSELDDNNVYQLLLTGIPGESYIMSCWVHWDETWPPMNQRQIFSGKIEAGGTEQSFNDDKKFNAVKNINGNDWEQVYQVITLPTNGDGSFKLNLGLTGDVDSGNRYITNIQVEAGGTADKPTPYMISGERVEEEDFPTTGKITFADSDTVKATFATDDTGFIPQMVGGKLTIKDAFVTDQNFTQDNEVMVLDDVEIANAGADDIIRDAGEVRVSPYHGEGTESATGFVQIWLQVDWEYGLFHIKPDGSQITIRANYDNNWAKSNFYLIPNFQMNDKLRLVAHNIGGKAGILTRIEHLEGTGKRGVYQSGDPEADYDLPDDDADDTFSVDNPGVWNIVEVDDEPYDFGTKVLHDYATDGDNSFWKLKKIHKKLKKSAWIWARETKNDQQVVFEWQPNDITSNIWRYPDPVLYSDAVKPSEWSDGFNWFAYGNNLDRRFDQSHWHSAWLGHHAKWVEGEGEFGETCMKFIDQNSEFGAPNHQNYQGEHRTGFNEDANQPETLAHRWLGISQRLPHKLKSQGIKVGDQITISWSQKSDTPNKGALVGLLHSKKSDGSRYWGDTGPSGVWGTNLSTVGTDENGVPFKEAWEREWFRYKPISKVGKWEKISYNAIVDENFDLTKDSVLYVYGNYGPEGILWVQNVQIQITENVSKVNSVPLLSDLIGEISSIQGNTATLNVGYESLSPDGTIFNNDANIRRWNTFTDFYVDYTSSLAESSPVYGTLRGDIENVSGNNITLKNTYTELGEQDGHDFNNTLDINQNSNFDKWFIQYPNDNQNDLSKLLKLGANNYSLITNFKYDTQEFPEYPHSLVYKLYEPLSDEIQEKDYVTVVREMIPPKEESATLVPFIEDFVSDIVLRTPEFGNTDSPIGAGQTSFKNYTQLTTSDTGLKESIENELISGSFSADINVDYSKFTNFIHFGSAEQRLKNFKYKLDLIQQYTDRSASIAGSPANQAGLHAVKANPVGYLYISGSSDFHPENTPVSGAIKQVQYWESQRREMINSFDKFEKYMFEESSSYTSESVQVYHDNAWPKESGDGTYSSPYVLYRTSQSLASNWYTNQLVSASDYDRDNKHRLKSHLPMFVQDDSENDVFLKFVEMIGHYFDDIWVFIKAMTDVYDRRDKLTEGIAKTLLEPVAKSLGWSVQDGKDLISLPQYMFGMTVSGSERPKQYSITPDRDISREIWSRIVNNMPYFLKTKGTSRAIKGLISCYGIPSSILRVMEYGGPKLPGQPADNMLIRRFTKSLNFYGASNNTYVTTNSWFPVISGSSATNRVPDTVEFRFKAASGSNQILVRRDTDWAIRLKDNASSDNRGHVSFMLSGSNGYLEVSSSQLPVYDGDFWSVMLTRTLSGSGLFVTSDTGSLDVAYTLYTKKYDAGRSKIIYDSEESLIITGSAGVNPSSYNIAYSGSGTSVTLGGPQENTFFGESFSGSMMEYRNWTTALKETAFDNHVSAPIAFDGNTPSASWEDLVTRYSFDDDKDLSVSENQWFNDVSADQSFTASATPSNYTSLMGDHFSPVVDETKMKVPNLGPSSFSSNKLRIEADARIDKVGNPVLKFGESITIPSYDNAPIDSNKLGIFFSPSAAINEDIITSMPNLDFDQYIGDPRDQYKEQYEGLTTARDLYWKKYSGPNNFWDYLRLLKYYDNSLYKQVRDLIPARANASVGILIEPTLLERDKIIIGKEPTIEPSHHVTLIEVGNQISESAFYQTYEDNVNWSVPFGINKEKMETGSYISSSAKYEAFETNLTYTDPFRVNYYTQLSGSEPRGFISASAMEITPEMLNTLPLNLHDPHRISNRTHLSGSGIALSADLVSYNAPSDTLSQQASGTGSFVLKHILERPALYDIGDKDDSGWYGTDYSGSTIQYGSVKTIFEEVLMPRYDRNVLSRFNDEVEYHYGNDESASKHIPNSSSFVRTDLDNRWDEAIGTERLFYAGCVQTDESTVADGANNYADNTPPIDVVLVSPTKLVTSDKTNTKMDVKNK